MTSIGRTKPPIWFWIVGILALLWNGMGVGEYIRQITMSAAEFAALPANQQELMIDQPFWLTAAFAIAVLAGFVASVLLLLRQRIAVRLFMVSMLAVFTQFGGLFLFKGYWDMLSGAEIVMPILIPIFAVGFAWFAWRCEKSGYLR
ncbi:hypothetical protein [Parasphingorhabdus halotolerans]|uniref:Sugar transporter n=1 Tax=Parasphingorhabdus halotolerans TaxID=2725558 RepID=A0A6H2DLC4_9SPHN|nr:hypothetical protein [Parasphingorhabdus halotolerans]QJB68456.1 hypothetical protein HF685_03345 [Parasphingorhabdus halotolerans]